MKRQLITVLCTAWMLYVGAQSSEWETNGNTGQNALTDFLGNTDDKPMNIRTEDIRRFRLNYDETYDIGDFFNVDKHGALVLSPDVDQFYTNGAFGPFSLLHLAAADDNAQQLSYRDWMDIGITMTGNDDQNYFGQKADGLDFTDVVVHWSDNPGKELTDKLRFIFTSDYDDGESTGALSYEGLEAMRMYPVSTDEVYVGIGDFYAAADEPAERLDVVTGNVRIRELPDAGNEMDTEDKFVVNDADGVLGWRAVPNDADCKWTLSGGTNNHDVWTALGSGTDCPNEDNLVGIGVNPTAAKLHVFSNTVDHDVPAIGAFVRLESDDDDSVQGIGVQVAPDGSSGYQQVGVSSLASNASFRNVGVSGKAELTASITMSDENVGVLGTSAVSNGTVTNVYGVSGVATRTGGTVSHNHGVFGYGTGGTSAYGVKAWGAGATTNYGLRAETWGTGTNYGVYSVGTGSGNYAGYFVGDVYITGVAGCTAMAWGSDENLKLNIQDITNASEVIAALRPTTYEFDVEGHPTMQLPSGLQRGLIAQEVAEIMPDLVHDKTIATYTDHDGVVHEGETIKSLNYIGFIPMLIAAMQEQQARIDNLEEALSNCCANMGGGAIGRIFSPIRT